MTTTSIKIYCDGGARGNPGPAASAFVVYDESDEELAKGSKFLGKTTNNIAEYSAVILALKWVKKNIKTLKKNNINFFLDSELVVNQLNGIYKIKNQGLAAKIIEIKKLEKEIGIAIKFIHVKRDKNPVADSLVNQALDTSTRVNL